LLRDGNADEAGQVAHRLKGAAASVSAEGPRQAAAEIERCARAGDLAGARAGLDTLRREARRCLDHLPAVRRAVPAAGAAGAAGPVAARAKAS
jgi:HPt (histidine-containing phosphotransfer) domain-containing protein